VRGGLADTAVNLWGRSRSIGVFTTGVDSRFSCAVKIGPAFRKGPYMAARQIKCITKLPNHQDRHQRIQAVAGDGFRDSEDTAIANVKRNAEYYWVVEQGKSVWVIVKQHAGRDYLKTQNDNFLPNNLLSLPECR